MNKKDFIKLLANKLESSKTEAARSLEAVVALVGEVFATKESLILPGFGTLGVKKRPARSGRNPSTGETIHIAETLVPFVRISAKIKHLLNQPDTTKVGQKVKKK